MSDGIVTLEQILRSLGLPMPDEPPQDLGSPRRTHVFIVDDLVVKCDADGRMGSGSMVRERAALELLRATDLPVPRLLHHGELGDRRAWVVLGRLDGAPPPDAAEPAHELSPALAAQLGAITARLHAAVVPPHFGTWSQLPRRSFAEEHWHRIGILEAMARDARVVPVDELDDLLALLGSTADGIGDVATPVLAPRDVQPRNVLVDDAGVVTALLDFESSAGGDPAEDFKIVGLDWTTPAFAAFTEAYVSAGGDVDATFADRVAHDVLEWVLAVYAYLGRIVPAYLEPARAAVGRVRAGERPPIRLQKTSRRNPSA